MRDLENEIDVSLLEANLELTPDERAAQHYEALKLWLALREEHKALYPREGDDESEPPA